MRIVGISGSLSPHSKTLLLVEKAINYAQSISTSVETEIISLREYNIQFCDGRDPYSYEGDTKLIIDKLIAADAFIIGTPIYRGSMTGALKNIFDVIPNDALRGKILGFIATGGTYHHFLAIEHQLHPIAGYFSAHVVPGGVYAHNDHFSNDGLIDSEILQRLHDLSKAIVYLSTNINRKYFGAEKPAIPRKTLPYE